MQRIAVIRIRGQIGLNKKIKDTLKMMNLYRRNSCVILKNIPSQLGMLNFVKDYVTWGEIDEATFNALLKNRGKLPGNKKLTGEYLKAKLNMTFDEFSKDFMSYKKELKNIPGIKSYFKLQPARYGYGNKGIKEAFSKGGALGYRKDKINELLMRMI